MKQCSERGSVGGKFGAIGAGVCMVCLIAGLFVAAPSSNAQCTAVMNPATTPAGSQMWVYWTLSMLATAPGGAATSNAVVACGAGGGMNIGDGGTACGQQVANSRIIGIGYPSMTMGNKTCTWSCHTTGGGGCAVSMDNSDGLPVELMEFSIAEDDDSEDQESQPSETD